MPPWKRWVRKQMADAIAVDIPDTVADEVVLRVRADGLFLDMAEWPTRVRFTKSLLKEFTPGIRIKNGHVHLKCSNGFAAYKLGDEHDDGTISSVLVYHEGPNHLERA